MDSQPTALIRQIVFHLENNSLFLPHFIFSLPWPLDLTCSYTPDTASALRGKVALQFFLFEGEDMTEDLAGIRLFSEHRSTLGLVKSLYPRADSSAQ